ncbi:MAG: tetratricopeptide repeat protein [Anaerolineae bacterium]|nr:tetratricopeptide repeat protein [Anaerolineae bacterium]
MSSFSPRDTLANRLMLLGCLLILVPCIVAALAAAFYGWPIVLSILPLGQRPVKAAEPGETLVLVTGLAGTGGTDPTDQIDEALRDAVTDGYTSSYMPYPTRVGRLADVPLSEQDARELGQRYNASIVLWGTYDPSDTYEVICTSLQTQTELEPTQFSLSLRQGDTSDMEDLADLVLTVVLYQAGDYYGADTVLSTLDKSINPSVIAFYHAEVYRAMGNGIQALSTVDAALSSDPDNAWLLTVKATVLRDVAQYEEALAAASASLEQEPSQADTYAVRGSIYQAMGDAQSALDDYKHALDLAPDNTDALRARAQTYQSLGNTEAALSDYARLIELEPEEYRNFLARAWLYTADGDKDAALADFEQALALAETADEHSYGHSSNYPYQAQTEVLEAQARALRSLGEYALALDVYNRLDSTGTFYSPFGHAIERGMTYWEMGDQEQAQDVWDETLLSSGAQDAAGYNNLAWSLAMQGYYEPALNYSNHSLELDAHEPNSLHTRGYIHLMLKEYQAALDDFSTALANGLNYPDVYRDMADAYAGLGKYKQAIENYETYLHLVPYAQDRHQVEERLKAAQAAYQP